MLAHLVQRLQTLQKETPYFSTILRGIERECLRTTADNRLAPSFHSKKLGSKLTHPHITTDYSENLLEFITSPHQKVQDLLDELMNLHAYTAQSIPGELFWPLSMPCILGTDEEIPIADYGTSHSARMKMQYRRGLWHRYGRHMQCISGLHYNFSLPQHFWEMWYRDFDPCHHNLRECIDANYLRLIRNYLKHAWLIFIVMGASPACDASFFPNTPPDFLSWNPPSTLFAPHACSLRMSNLGYQSSVQDKISISYNSLESYLKDLKAATEMPNPAYQMITEQFGEDAQLNSNLLQIEAELYAPIRPKHTVNWGERPIKALAERGIEYVEVRGIDINPYSPIGIEADQIYFLDTFLLFCLLHNSPTFSLDNAMQWHNNQGIAVLQGLSQDCTLYTGDRTIFADTWAAQVFDQLAQVTQLLDQHEEGTPHAQAIERYRDSFFSRSPLYAAKQLSSVKQGVSFIEFGADLARSHNQALIEHPLPEKTRILYEKMAENSLLEQEIMERNQEVSYQDYVNSYFHQ